MIFVNIQAGFGRFELVKGKVFMGNETILSKPSNQLNFEDLYQSRSAKLVIDMSKAPRAIVESMKAYSEGRLEDGQEIIRKSKGELEGLIDELGCDVRFYLATLYERMCDLKSAKLWYDSAASLKPVDYRFWINVSMFYLQIGEYEKYKEMLSKVIDCPEENRIYAIPYELFSLHYDHKISRSELFSKHAEWGRLVSEEISPRDIDFDIKSSGRIRVGYVSADFKKHPVTFFAKPLIENHNREKFEIFGYGNVSKCDIITEKMSGVFDNYRNIFGKSDDEVADLIIEDRIDILVDLGGHTTEDRMLVFARRPAPIQVTYLGYPDTTGLETMDYRFTDSLAETEDCADYHTEKPVFLPGTFLCYNPYKGIGEVSQLSALESGYVTFGSFNNSLKLNPIIVGLWSKVLVGVKGSRMIIKIKGGDDENVRGYLYKMFEDGGVSSDRVEIIAHVTDSEHFELYSRIDIALDSYPYHGTTTTCEAMWMGVPVVSLVGEHHMSRVGNSLLTRVGLEYFATKTEEEFVKKAVALAVNVESLGKIRQSLRRRMALSGLCDGPGFARKVEDAYEQMVADWQKSH